MSQVERCERCGKPLAPGKEVWLELSNTDNNFYQTIPEDHVSQGCFPFGMACATTELQETNRKLLRKIKSYAY